MHRRRSLATFLALVSAVASLSLVSTSAASLSHSVEICQFTSTECLRVPLTAFEDDSVAPLLGKLKRACKAARPVVIKDLLQTCRHYFFGGPQFDGTKIVAIGGTEPGNQNGAIGLVEGSWSSSSSSPGTFFHELLLYTPLASVSLFESRSKPLSPAP